MNKIKNYPVLIFAPDRTFRVEGEFNSTKNNKNQFIDGKGYLDNSDDYVWIYSIEPPRDANQYPYFWFEGSSIVKSDPSKDTLDYFHLEKCVDYSNERILKTARESEDDQPLYNDEKINDLNASSEIFRPAIYQKDDFLKKIIKTAINEIEVRLSRYKHQMSQKYMISNMTSALRSPTKMSTLYFNSWIEMFNWDVTIIVNSTEQSEDKLPEPLVYLSSRDSVFKLSELGPDFKFPEIPKKNDDE